MKQGHHKPNSRTPKLLKKVLGQRFTFEESQADLELLRSIHEGTYANTKPGDPSAHAYMAAVNTTTDFATQALEILELTPFNNQIFDIEEEYMPSYPPMSPVTKAFWANWVSLDAHDSFTGVTMGGLFAQYLQHTGSFDYLQKAMKPLNDSFCSFYEVTEVNDQGVKLWDIAGRQEFQCWNGSGYPGCEGEVWYVRLLPPFSEEAKRSVTMGTPYVFRDGDRRKWEQFFERQQRSLFVADQSLRDYLKFGTSLGYWLEFVFQAFAGYTGNMILVTGVPDDPASLPHSDPRHKL